MVWIILILGFLVIGFCLAILAAPKILRRVLAFYALGSRLYAAAILRIVSGVLLLILAINSRLWAYVFAIGLLLVTSGASAFFFGLRRTKKILLRLSKQSNLVLRFYMILLLAIWLILLYALLPELPAVLQR